MSSVSNFRAYNYSIPRETHFKIKEIAGNIIPAVSSTNGLVAAIETAETIKILNQSYNTIKAVSYQGKAQKVKIISTLLSQESPNPNCLVC